MKLLVGCPIQDRAWIISEWFAHVERSTGSIVPHYVFVGDPRTDPGTFASIDSLCLKYGRSRDVIEVSEDFVDRGDTRDWGHPRFLHMADLRNTLLGHVRKLGPDLFWSLDADILVADDTFTQAVEMLGTGYDAVGTKCYMSESRRHPSYGNLSGIGGLKRSDTSGRFQVEVIMASKLMSPTAYEIDYSVHQQGEDVGWSLNAKRAGCRLGWDGSTCSKHVMKRANLDVLDPRCGF